MKTFHFTIVTPHGTSYEDEVGQVTIPTEMGDITVLPDHIPLVSVLKPGALIVTKHDGSVVELAVSGGVLEVHEARGLSILADTAEFASDIDVARAEEAKKRAEELLKEVTHVEDVAFAAAQAQIEKELARLNVAKRYRP